MLQLLQCLLWYRADATIEYMQNRCSNGRDIKFIKGGFSNWANEYWYTLIIRDDLGVVECCVTHAMWCIIFVILLLYIEFNNNKLKP